MKFFFANMFVWGEYCILVQGKKFLINSEILNNIFTIPNDGIDDFGYTYNNFSFKHHELNE